MKIFSILVAMASFTSSAALADGLVHLTHRIGYGADGGLAIPSQDSNFENDVGTGWSVGAHIDYNLSDAIGIEAQYQHFVYQTGNPLSNTYTLGLNYRWLPSAAITPVLGIAGGWGWSTGIRGLDSSYDNFIAIGKFAVDFRLSDQWMFEAAAKYDWLFSKTSGSDDQQTLNPTVGLTYYLGASEDHDMTMKEEMDKEKAHDRDLEAQAAAARAQTAAANANAASANASAASANAVLASAKCQNVPAGTPVNSLGCPVGEKVSQTIDIQFRSGKATFSPEYNTELDKIVDLLNQHTDVKAEIQGYTDNTGGAAKNQKLSERRAQAVQKYIVSHGIDASRVSYKGYGEENAIADNSTVEGRKQNRRVVASIQSM